MKSVASVLMLAAALVMVPVVVAEGACSDYEFRVQFGPAFHPTATVVISTQAGRPEVTIAYGVSRDLGRRVEHLALSAPASAAFCARVVGLLAIRSRPVDRLVVDGVSVKGELWLPASPPQTFSSRSPDPADSLADHGIVDAVFTVFESTIVSCELNEYLENLTGYFRFGSSARVLAVAPYTVRFWRHAGADATRILSTLPGDGPVTFDLTNWDAYGTLPSEFQALLRRVPPIRWVVSPTWAASLRRLGAEPASIDVKEGAHCPIHPMRFARH